MGTKLQYKISLAVNTVVSLIFILVVALALLNTGQEDAVAIVMVTLISFSCIICLLFNYACYSLLKINKENKAVPEWIISYKKTILVLTIIALVIISFVFVAAAVTFFSNYTVFPSRQRPFYIVYLFFIFTLVVSGIENIICFLKSLKQNKLIVNSVINTIGENAAA